MNKKQKKIQISNRVFRWLLISFLLIIGFSLTGQQLWGWIKDLVAFKVKTIILDPSLKDIQLSELNQLRGKSIFDVNLSKVEKKILLRYRNLQYLRLKKRYPDQIEVVVIRRQAIAQLQVKNQSYILDKDGYVLSQTAVPSRLPSILGISLGRGLIKAGQLVQGQQIDIALNILRTFHQNQGLAQFRIAKIDVSNLSKINFYLSNDFKILMDRYRIPEKLDQLSLVLNRSQEELHKYRYIDLRFNDPILGTQE